jgi:hypothetical protein
MTPVFAIEISRWHCIGAADSNHPDGQHDSFASPWRWKKEYSAW